MLLDEGKAKRAPVTDHDVCLAVVNALTLENTKGQIFELGANQTYTLRELYEYFSNAMSHRPKYISYSFEDFMKLHLGPNFNFEKSVNWLISRPDYLSELRYDIVPQKRDGIKTFEDLYITPVAPHHSILDLSNWMIEKLVLDKVINFIIKILSMFYSY
jgi:nucleoside-diphosphate-sugar epimerase